MIVFNENQIYYRKTEFGMMFVYYEKQWLTYEEVYKMQNL